MNHTYSTEPPFSRLPGPQTFVLFPAGSLASARVTSPAVLRLSVLPTLQFRPLQLTLSGPSSSGSLSSSYSVPLSQFLGTRLQANFGTFLHWVSGAWGPFLSQKPRTLSEILGRKVLPISDTAGGLSSQKTNTSVFSRQTELGFLPSFMSEGAGLFQNYHLIHYSNKLAQFYCKLTWNIHQAPIFLVSVSKLPSSCLLWRQMQKARFCLLVFQ